MFALIDEKLGYQVYLKYLYIYIYILRCLLVLINIIIKYCRRYEISLKIGRI